MPGQPHRPVRYDGLATVFAASVASGRGGPASAPDFLHCGILWPWQHPAPFRCDRVAERPFPAWPSKSASTLPASHQSKVVWTGLARRRWPQAHITRSRAGTPGRCRRSSAARHGPQRPSSSGKTPDGGYWRRSDGRSPAATYRGPAAPSSASDHWDSRRGPLAANPVGPPQRLDRAWFAARPINLIEVRAETLSTVARSRPRLPMTTP